MGFLVIGLRGVSFEFLNISKGFLGFFRIVLIRLQEPSTSGLEKIAPPGELEFSPISN